MSNMPTDRTHRVVDRCRICGSDELALVVSLGSTPLANSFVAPDRVGEPEPRFALEALRCGRCGLVQLSVVVRPEIMFAHYAYASSASRPSVEHFDELAEELVERFSLAGAFVVEVGSNDGVLLAPLKARQARALGYEPAENMAALANQRGLETLVGLFDSAGARRLAAERGGAKLVVANNVLAHIDDLHDVVAALDALLDDDGVFVAEFPYVEDLLDRVEYDTIYHEHLSYFGLTPLTALFPRGGMEIFDVRRLPVHGGSIRIYAGRHGKHAIDAGVGAMLEDEHRAGILDPATYTRFASRVEASRAALRTMLSDQRGKGRRIAGLGASAKGNTLLNYCHIGPETVTFIGDSTPQKHGLLTPGMHIPVRPEEAIAAERPDRTLLLAWNYADAIVARYAGYVARGGRFIHPIPLARSIP